LDDGGDGDEVAVVEVVVVCVDDVVEFVVSVDGGEVGEDGECVPGEDAVLAGEESCEVVEVWVEEEWVFGAEDDEGLAGAVADGCGLVVEAGEKVGQEGGVVVDLLGEAFGRGVLLL
jgi:hypothetical protein